MNPFSVLSRTQQTKSTGSSKSAKADIIDTLAEPKFPTKQFEYIEGRNYRQTKKPITDLLERGIRVLNVSAGPGWWALDMAKQYPKSHFTSVDAVLYPISQPPANCHFRLMDVSSRLAFPDNTFDYVTQYDAIFKYSQKDWETIIPELVRVVKPGGYIEFCEFGGAIQDVGPNLSIWMMRLTVSLQTRNINLKIASQLESMIKEIDNVTHIESSHRSAPIGWYGKNGDIMLECIKRLLESVKPKLCEDWSMNVAKYDKMVESAIKECKEFKSWCNIHYTIAQKNN